MAMIITRCFSSKALFCIIAGCLSLPSYASAIAFLQLDEPRDSKHAVKILDCRFCVSVGAHGPNSKLSKTPPRVLRLTENGRVLSSNPVWNVCISGKPISIGLIRRNRDVFDYRRGHLHVSIPYTCRDYHRGQLAVWKHPDFADLDLTLDPKGRLVGGVPAGFVVMRGGFESLIGSR